MKKYGGGFASRLADAWMHADGTNQAKLEGAFGYILDGYEQFLKEQDDTTEYEAAEVWRAVLGGKILETTWELPRRGTCGARC